MHSTGRKSPKFLNITDQEPGAKHIWADYEQGPVLGKGCAFQFCERIPSLIASPPLETSKCNVSETFLTCSSPPQYDDIRGAAGHLEQCTRFGTGRRATRGRPRQSLRPNLSLSVTWGMSNGNCRCAPSQDCFRSPRNYCGFG